jgi:hypothetical protein
VWEYLKRTEKQPYMIYHTTKTEKSLKVSFSSRFFNDEATTVIDTPLAPTTITSAPNHLQRLKTVFKSMLEASYMPLATAEKQGQELDYILDRDISVEHTHVYIDILTGFPLIVHRGSSSITDWLVEDVLLATGVMAISSSPRIMFAKSITKEVEEKYGKPTDAFGHSLAGKLIEESGAHGYIFTYNKGTGFADIRKSIKNPKQTDYRHAKDIVSMISETQSDNNIVYVGEDAPFYSAHNVNILPDVAQRR